MNPNAPKTVYGIPRNVAWAKKRARPSWVRAGAGRETSAATSARDTRRCVIWTSGLYGTSGTCPAMRRSAVPALRALIVACNRSSAVVLEDVVARAPLRNVGTADPTDRAWLTAWRGRYDVVVFLGDELLQLIRRRLLRPADLQQATTLVLVSSDLQLTEVLHEAGPVQAVPLGQHRSDRVGVAVDLGIAGYAALPPEVLHHLVEERIRVDRLVNLSAEERSVLAMLGQGVSNREMGETFGVPTERIKSVVRAVLAKLGFRNRTAAAIFAVRHRVAGGDGA